MCKEIIEAYIQHRIVPAQAILHEMDRPLLCSSAHVEEQEELEIPEAAVLMDSFAGQGLDFIVDAGHEQRVRQPTRLYLFVELHGIACVAVNSTKQ